MSIEPTSEQLAQFEQRQAARITVPAHASALNRAIEYLHKLTAGNFYGTIELTFEAGKVLLIKQHRTIKL